MSFNVKKTSTACAVAMAMFAASWGAHAADPTPNPGQATVNFKATVTDQTCTPDWSADGVSVDFHNVSKTDLATEGSVGSKVPFSLSLKGCSGVTGVIVSTGGTTDDANQKVFANTSTEKGAATHVGFALLAGDKQTPLVPNDSTSTVEYKVPSTTTQDKDGNNVVTYADHVVLPFVAEVVATADAATSGPASGSATLYMTYE